MNERHATEAPEASAKGRKRYPPTERGVRVRIYPFEDQETALIAKCRARAIIWNWTCDVFDRTRAKALDEHPRGLAIKCTQSAVGAEIERLRRDPAYGWLRKTLTLWSCKRVVKQAFAARNLAFAGHAEHPAESSVPNIGANDLLRRLRWPKERRTLCRRQSVSCPHRRGVARAHRARPHAGGDDPKPRGDGTSRCLRTLVGKLRGRSTGRRRAVARRRRSAVAGTGRPRHHRRPRRRRTSLDRRERRTPVGGTGAHPRTRGGGAAGGATRGAKASGGANARRVVRYAKRSSSGSHPTTPPTAGLAS